MTSQASLIRETAWRYLLVLDACRYDDFAEIVGALWPGGALHQVDTDALDTRLWYQYHWSLPHPHVSLISASPVPWVRELNVVKNFNGCVPVWMPEANIGQGGVVYPETMMGVIAVKARNTPGRRWVCHFVQPHLPYITADGLAFLRGELDADLRGDNWLKRSPTVYDKVQAWGRRHGWERLRGYYQETLEFTLGVIKRRLTELPPGRVVITSDHSELIGERGLYGHPRPAGKELLCTVPWFEVSRAGVGM